MRKRSQFQKLTIHPEIKLFVDMEKQKGADHIPLVCFPKMLPCKKPPSRSNMGYIFLSLISITNIPNPHLRHGFPGRCFLLHDLCLVNFRNWGKILLVMWIFVLVACLWTVRQTDSVCIKKVCSFCNFLYLSFQTKRFSTAFTHIQHLLFWNCWLH